MIATTVGGEQLKIWFRHERFPEPREHIRKNGSETLVTAETECVIVQGAKKEEEFVVASGKARCSLEDQFNYGKARETALLHALGMSDREPAPAGRVGRLRPLAKQKKLTFTRETTGALLAAYFGRKQQGR